MALQAAKINLRNKIKTKVAEKLSETVKEDSENVINQLCETSYYKKSLRIGVYMSLPEEVQTQSLICNIFSTGRECFIPRYTKTNMSMVKLMSLDDMENLPVTKWNIKQPLVTEDREDAFLKGGLDMVIVPGLAFTKDGKRLGRGKGYYDRYLQALKLYRESNQLSKCFTVGFAFSEQIVEEIPTAEYDFKVDLVLYPK